MAHARAESQHTHGKSVCIEHMRFSAGHPAGHGVGMVVQGRFDYGDPEDARVGASLDEPPDPPEILAAQGGILDLPCEPGQQAQSLAEQGAPGLCRVPGMPPPVAVRAAAEVQPGLQVECLEPLEIRGGIVQGRQDMDKPVAELLAADAEGDDIGAELWLGRGVKPPFLGAFDRRAASWGWPRASPA